MFNLGTKSRPILKWAGGKTGLLPQLTKHFPNHFQRYIEPFFGGGAVFFSLKNGVPAVLNDVNKELFNLYSVVRDSPQELMRALDVLTEKYSEEFYYELRTQSPPSFVDMAARTVFLNKTGFNGLYRQNSKGGFNVPYGKRTKCPALYETENLMTVCEKLRNAEIRNQDFESVINDAGAGDFVYCDPPYEPLSATSSFNAYTGGGFSQADQRRLRDACASAAHRGAVVAVSNSSAPFVKSIYEDWDIRTVLAKRAINSNASSRGEIEEVLVLLQQSVSLV